MAGGLLGLFQKNKERGKSNQQPVKSNYIKKERNETPVCPYCKSKGLLENKKWVCSSCEDVSVGTYNGSTRPLGVMADRDTRAWRVRVHDELSYKWEYGQSKDEFYGWIGTTLKRGNKPSTIANLNTQECKILIREGRKELYQMRYKEIFTHH